MSRLKNHLQRQTDGSARDTRSLVCPEVMPSVIQVSCNTRQ
jgi:hypothetical protein